MAPPRTGSFYRVHIPQAMIDAYLWRPRPPVRPYYLPFLEWGARSQGSEQSNAKCAERVDSVTQGDLG